MADDRIRAIKVYQGTAHVDEERGLVVYDDEGRIVLVVDGSVDWHIAMAAKHLDRARTLRGEQ